MIYIIQFERPLGNDRHSARYYIGWCEDGKSHERLKAHQRGNGAAITRAANALGIKYHIICTLEGDRNTERLLKRMKNTPRILRQIQKRRFTLTKVRTYLWTD
ncbi:MAG: endonuclease [Chloroflexi bacterium]|nr:endonuclease [Chloroflexota bacterium]